MNTLLTQRTVIWKIRIITAATYGLKSGGEFRCDGVDSCHECKFWLVPRSDLVDHLTSPHREGSVPVGQTVLLEFVWHDCECGHCEEKFEKKNGASLEPQSCRSSEKSNMRNNFPLLVSFLKMEMKIVMRWGMLCWRWWVTPERWGRGGAWEGVTVNYWYSKYFNST